MAEAYLNSMAGDRFTAESAGIEPGVLNPLVVESMKEDGIDISGNRTKSVFDFYNQGKKYDYVITVCEKEAAEKCPVFAGITEKLAWSFGDPSKLEGTNEEKALKINGIRNEIRDSVRRFIEKHA